MKSEVESQVLFVATAFGSFFMLFCFKGNIF